MGDSVEVEVSSWVVEGPTLGRLQHSTRQSKRGLRLKLGGDHSLAALEPRLLGLRRQGRRFILQRGGEAEDQAWDVEVTKVRDRDQQPEAANEEAVARSSAPPAGAVPLPGLHAGQVSDAAAPHGPKNVVSEVSAQVPPAESPTARPASPALSVRSGAGGAGGLLEAGLLLAEARLQTTEQRLQLQRLTDKLDRLLDLPARIDSLAMQNTELRAAVERAGAGQQGTRLGEREAELEQAVAAGREEAGRLRVELAAQRNAVQAAHRSSRVSSQEETRKLLGSSARLLTSQFQPDRTYSGQVGARNYWRSNN